MSRDSHDIEAERAKRSGLARLGGGIVGAVAGLPFGAGAALLLPFRILGGDCDLEGFAGLICLTLDAGDFFISLIVCLGLSATVGGIIGWWLGKAVAAREARSPNGTRTR